MYSKRQNFWTPNCIAHWWMKLDTDKNIYIICKMTGRFNVVKMCYLSNI